jgi:hypothetical protein
VNSTAQDQIGDYVAGVRAALVGLPDSTRDELLEDLPEHLAEVLAEDQGTLVERLGTPEAYAAELLATAGFVGGFPDPPRRSSWAPLDEARDNVLSVLRLVDARVGPVIGYQRASEFLALLRPAWWVLRGYLAAMVIAFMFGENGGNLGLLPRLGGSEVVALILLAACVIVSILLGQRTASLSKWPRYALWSGTALLSLFAIGGFLGTDSDARYDPYSGVSNYDGNPFSNVQDVYVYDGQGRLVTDARLFDQDGSPIQLGNTWCSDPETGESRNSRKLGYPRCPEFAPFGARPSGAATRVSPAPTATSETPAGVESLTPADQEPTATAPAVSGTPSPARSVTPSGR